jgi:hypothetical protein
MQIGGKPKIKSKWDIDEEKRMMQQKNMKNTKSYISKKNFTVIGNKYFVDDNGNKPFMIDINKKGIFIYKRNLDINNVFLYEQSGKYDYEMKIIEGFHKLYIYNELIIKLKLSDVQGYFYGYDSSQYKSNGNSLLIKLGKKNTYLYIGSVIYVFQSDDIILDYISYMGGNDVPYPVAYTNEYVYFMLDCKKVKRSDLVLSATVSNAGNIYGEFYGHINNNPNLKKTSFKCKILAQRLY